MLRVNSVGTTSACDPASIFACPQCGMRHLVYIRYLWLDMTNMFERGEKAALDFMNTNVLCSKPDIYVAIGKTNLKTFSQMSTNMNSKNGKGDVVAVKNSLLRKCCSSPEAET